MNKIEAKNRQCTSPSIGNAIWILPFDTICLLKNYCRIVRHQCCKVKKNNRRENEGTQRAGCNHVRVADIGSLSARTKRAIKFSSGAYLLFPAPQQRRYFFLLQTNEDYKGRRGLSIFVTHLNLQQVEFTLWLDSVKDRIAKDITLCLTRTTTVSPPSLYRQKSFLQPLHPTPKKPTFELVLLWPFNLATWCPQTNKWR